VQKSSIQVDVCIFGFDLLYLNEKSLLQTEFVERRKLLHEHFEAKKPQFQFAIYSDNLTPDQMSALLEESVRSSCEGLMVKTLKENSSYEPSKRTFKWLKLKKDYIDNGIGDSLDLVVVGADYGTGKRTGVYGSFLLAVYDADTETFQTVSKIGTGLSDEDLQVAYNELKDLRVENIYFTVRHKDVVIWLWESRIQMCGSNQR
jgi:DNA ligase-1